MSLQKRIALLSDKPLPTQEQIDWRVENPSGKKSIHEEKGERLTGNMQNNAEAQERGVTWLGIS